MVCGLVSFFSCFTLTMYTFDTEKYMRHGDVAAENSTAYYWGIPNAEFDWW